jgi:acyl-CoA reductase-like NAD-dependent aldehyde dehydrogenase
MDWDKIKRHADQFDRLLKKQLTVNEVDPEVSHALAFVMYADARWIAELPKDERKEALQRVHEICRDDVRDMAALIIKGDIP